MCERRFGSSSLLVSPLKVTMKRFILLLLLQLHRSEAVIHSVKFFHTGSSGLTNFPEFVAVIQLDGVEMVHYDSNTRRAEAKQDWMEKLTADDPKYWEGQTQISMGDQQVFKVNIERAKQLFNQTEGVHMYQWMYGCEWDDETGETIDGFSQYAFDGEDFISFDLKTQTWVAAKQQAVITKHKWDNLPGFNTRWYHDLSQICPELVKEFLNYGRSFLLRTELPSVFLLQKTPSSPITCLATGFHPDRAMLLWRKDGEELHEGVDVEETLPNHDGSFQSSAHLDPPPDDWQRYECVFQLAGVKGDVVTRLDKAAVRSNSDPVDDISIISIVLAVVAALLLLGGAGVAGFLVYRKKQERQIERRPQLFGSSHLHPLAGVSTEHHGTLMQPADSDSASRCSADSEAPRSADSEALRPDNEVPQSEGSDPDVEDTD